MATKNKPVKVPAEKTHEGATAARINAEQQLRRSVMACMLWEDTFYESGEDIGTRILGLIEKVKPEKVLEIAIEARTKQKLRHCPLLIVRQMARLKTHKHLVAQALEAVIQRPDELTEFLAIYWKDKKEPLSAQVKKGLANAFGKFNEYSLAKYNKDGKVKLKDVLFLCHAKPEVLGQQVRMVTRKYKNGSVKELLRHDDSLQGKLVADKLETPDTWEVKLSGGADKKETFERLMQEKKLFALAFLRNLRNMKEAGVSLRIVQDYAQTIPTDRVLPFRFISAARAVPGWEPMIEEMMLRCMEELPKLAGKTCIIVDNSGSMHGAKVSARSEIDRSDAACALAILVRGICEEAVVIGFGNQAQVIPARKGFALADAIKKGPGGGTDTNKAIKLAAKEGYDRIIVITDEQSHTAIDAPKTDKAYFINVANYQNGIGYGKWTHIDGWSESIIDYIQQSEQNQE